VPTSKDQKAASLWALSGHKPVIPLVIFLTPLTLNNNTIFPKEKNNSKDH